MKSDENIIYPSKIDNRTLNTYLNCNNVLRLKEGEHYSIVNEVIWGLFVKLYGGEPEIKLEDFEKAKKRIKKNNKSITKSKIVDSVIFKNYIFKISNI